MKDLIYRQDAIDAIDVKNVNKGIISALQSIVEELPPAQQWTPISEGEPKENGKYLVSLKKIEWDGSVRYSVMTMSYNKVEVVPFQWGHYEIYSGKVTAWMQLPEPYKGGDIE